MLSYYDLLYLKEAYSDDELIYVAFEGKEFVFRGLTREEYKQILTVIEDDFEFEDAVCQTTLVYPDEYDFSNSYLPGLSAKVTPEIIKISYLNDMDSILNIYYTEKLLLVYPDEYDFSNSYLPGLSAKVTPEIIKISYLNDMDSILNIYYTEKLLLSNFEEQCVTMVKAAFQEYSIEEIEKWNWKKLIRYTAKAENVLLLRGVQIATILQNMDKIKETVKEKEKETQKQLSPKEIGDNLRQNGIDPMEYFSYEFKDYTDNIEYPIIGTYHWKDEEMLSDIREQMERKHGKRKFKQK